MNEIILLEKSEYILVNYNSIASIAFLANEILDSNEAKELSDELGKVITSIAFYDDYDINEFLISKDSLIGKFIMNPNRKKYLKCIDAFIEYEDIVNAFMFASINKNYEMANNISLLLNAGVSGFIADLKNNYDYDTLLFIYNSKSLKDFVFSNIENSTKRYFVFEDGNISTISSSSSYTLKL